MPPENEKADDAAERQFIPLREPPGRLGAIVRRLKRLEPPPPPRILKMESDAKCGTLPEGE